MDLHVRHAGPTDEERAAVDGLLGPPPSQWRGGDRNSGDGHVALGGREQRQRRHLLLPALQALQARVGWISETGLDYICTRLDVPPADAWGVATFYSLLSTTPRAPRVVHVCDDIACRCAGADELLSDLERACGPAHSHGPSGTHFRIDPSGAVWMRSPCLGMCDHAPAAFIQQAGVNSFERSIPNATIDGVLELLGGAINDDGHPDGGEAAGGPAFRSRVSARTGEHRILSTEVLHGQPISAEHQDDWEDQVVASDSIEESARASVGERSLASLGMPPESSRGASATRDRSPGEAVPPFSLLARVGVVDPTDIAAYRRSNGFAALRKAIEIGPDEILREVTDSKLLGRGGAAFPTGRKWDAVAKQAARPHYLICNADESEPGTFKDRVLLDGDPFAIVEAMTIAGYATGCHRAFLYIRGEYPLGTERIQHAINEARKHGFLGKNILNRGIDFDIEIRRGGGAYICGEETAIFNSIEGYRGEPRNKPPFPAQAGLFGLPTVVNNVETLANVPHIILHGGATYAKIGTEQSTGTRLFCLSGNVTKPGTYEVPFGKTLRELLDMAGGVANGRSLQTILLGGAAGVFVRPDELDMQLTFEGVRAAKATLGSGVIVAFDDTVDMTQILARIAGFFRDESCGQCVPCRVGTVRQEEALYRIASGKTLGGVPQEVALLDEVGVAMKDASICGLGQTAYAAIESAIHRVGVLKGRM
jgi:NADH-quinone oxidoreductase subunit F